MTDHEVQSPPVPCAAGRQLSQAGDRSYSRRWASRCRWTRSRDLSAPHGRRRPASQPLNSRAHRRMEQTGCPDRLTGTAADHNPADHQNRQFRQGRPVGLLRMVLGRFSGGSTWDHVRDWIGGLLLRNPFTRVPRSVLLAWLVLWLITLAVIVVLIAAMLPETAAIGPYQLWDYPPLKWLRGFRGWLADHPDRRVGPGRDLFHHALFRARGPLHAGEAGQHRRPQANPRARTGTAVGTAQEGK